MRSEAANKLGFDLSYRAYDSRLGAYAYIINDGKILLSRWANAEQETWTLPGGGVEYHETCEEAVRREVHEESGLSIRLGQSLCVDVAWVPSAERIEECEGKNLKLIRVIYAAEVSGGEIRFENEGSSDEVRWFPIEKVNELRVAGMVEAAFRVKGTKENHGSDNG